MQHFAVPGAPDAELARSPAAAAVGRHAAAAGLRLAHFEHRVHLPLPEAWLPHDRPDLRDPGGHLAEHKYAQHRNDNPVGSFNPGHRAKWTAHELCHGLVGFAWRPDATPLFHTLAARLSEVLPVALWYFLDEAGLRRCPDHDGPLFGAFCAACEAAAGPHTEIDPRWFAQGRQFVDRELAAVARSIRLGRPITRRFATLDLNSDALAYAVSHGQRLSSETFRRYHALFQADGQLGAHDSLDALAQRVEAVLEGLTGGRPPAPWAGAARIVAQDLGWRLLQVAAETEGEAEALLYDLAAQLAHAPDAIAPVVAAYAEAAEAFWLPPPAEMFAVGYDVDGLGRDPTALADGLADTCPATEALLADEFPTRVAAFVAEDAPLRQPAARRFATWLTRTDPGPIADLARYEAACAHPHPADVLGDSLGAGDGPEQLAPGVEVLRLGIDAGALVRALDGGDAEGADRSTCVAIRRTAGGDVLVAEISPVAADALSAGDFATLSAEERASLRALGLIRAARWTTAAVPDRR